MGNEGSGIKEDHIYFLEKQEIVVHDFDIVGFVLDIGGGGEGVIGQLKGEQVVAIDPNRRELEEAASGPLKIVMDAADLQFLDSSFAAATSFFTLMYIPSGEHEAVFQEVYRVLRPGGRFLVWDANLPQRLDEEKDIVAFSLTVSLPDQEIDTGYGAKWPEQIQDLAYYREIAEQVGFIVCGREERGRLFHLALQKP